MEQQYLNRDISWLSFNERVMDESSKKIPLAERLLFLGITQSNLDEFMMTRYPTSLDYTVDDDQQLLRKALVNHYQTLMGRYDSLNDKEKVVIPIKDILDIDLLKWIDNHFKKNIFPALQPITFSRNVQPKRMLYLFIETADHKNDQTFYNFIEIPKSLPRFVKLPGRNSFVYIEDVISRNINTVFKDMNVLNVASFSILRSSEMYFQDDSYRDQYELIEHSLKDREKSWITRIEIGSNNSDVIRLLLSLINVTNKTIVCMAEHIQISDIKTLDSSSFNDDDKMRKLNPSNPFPTDELVFDTLKNGDRLVFHPYESYRDSFVRFIEEAAVDDDVISIKITLYRVADKSRIITALIKAAEMGKSVTALVELKARFDEHHNITISKILKEAGVRLVYGTMDLKTHAKLCVVTRNEKSGLKIYSHIGTGNYNESNAMIYTDYSYFTVDQLVGTDLTKFFNLLTSVQSRFKSKKILYAPYNLREEINEKINEEIKYANKNKDARIIFKCNSLTDDKIASKLEEAAKAGVHITLIIRGACIMRPSKHIKIYSIVGRFLEHSRVYVFGRGDRESIYIGSNDIMHRNLNLRNELMFMIEDKNIKARIKDHIKAYLKDTVNRRIITDDYGYDDAVPDKKDKPFDCQKWFIKEAKRP